MTPYNVDFSTENSNIVEVERVCVLPLPIWADSSSTVMYWNPMAMIWTEYVQAMPCSHYKLGGNSSMFLVYVLFHSEILWNLSSVKFSFECHVIVTILDKTVEKIAYLGGIFSKLRSRPILPSPPPPGSNVVGSSKESRIPKHLWEATLDWGRGFSLRKAVDLC